MRRVRLKENRKIIFLPRSRQYHIRRQVKCCTRHAQLQHMPHARKVLLSRHTSSCVRLATFYARTCLSRRCRSNSVDPDGEWPRRRGDLPTQLFRMILSVPLISNVSQTSALRNTVLIRDKQLTRAKKERTASDEGRPWIYVAVSRSVGCHHHSCESCSSDMPLIRPIPVPSLTQTHPTICSRLAAMCSAAQ